jgi:hypothetical protein
MPGQRAAEHPGRGIRAMLAQHQMCGQIAGRPARAERRGVWPGLIEQGAEREAFFP